MPFKVACSNPDCPATLSVGEHLVGKTVICPKCQWRTPVTNPAEPPAKATPAPIPQAQPLNRAIPVAPPNGPKTPMQAASPTTQASAPPANPSALPRPPQPINQPVPVAALPTQSSLAVGTDVAFSDNRKASAGRGTQGNNFEIVCSVKNCSIEFDRTCEGFNPGSAQLGNDFKGFDKPGNEFVAKIVGRDSFLFIQMLLKDTDRYRTLARVPFENIAWIEFAPRPTIRERLVGGALKGTSVGAMFAIGWIAVGGLLRGNTSDPNRDRALALWFAACVCIGALVGALVAAGVVETKALFRLTDKDSNTLTFRADTSQEHEIIARLRNLGFQVKKGFSRWSFKAWFAKSGEAIG